MTIQIDNDLKDRTEAFFANHGMDVSTAINNGIKAIEIIQYKGHYEDK